MNENVMIGNSVLTKREYPSKLLGASLIGNEELKELQDVINEKSLFRYYGIGNPSKVNSFEKDVAAFLAVKFALGVSSGSAALFCAMAAINTQPGDEVILPAFSWYSDYNSIVNFGAIPVYADIDETMCLCAKDFEKKITDRTKAVIMIHYQGSAGKADEIVDIAHSHGIVVIEDVAQAFGGEYNNKKLGTLGDIAITSFQNNKIITCGEGGLVYTNNENYFERAIRYHDLGFVRSGFADYFNDKSLTENTDRCFAGFQFRMNEMQGAVLKAQLRKLPYLLERCRDTFNRIVERIDSNIKLEIRPVHNGHCGISLFLGFENAETAHSASLAMALEGVPLGVASSCANLLHNEHVMKRIVANGSSVADPSGSAQKGDTCPNTDPILSRYVGIGIGPLYSKEDSEEIAGAINRALKSIS